MGGAVDFVGDVVGGAADAVGDVIGGVGDIVGDVVETVGDNLNPATIAAIIYLATTGDPSALIAEEGSAAAAEAVLADIGEQGFMDLLSTYGSDAAAAGEIMGGFEPVINAGSLFESIGTGELGSTLESLGSQFDINDALNAGDYAQTGIGNEVSTEQANSIWDQLQSEWNQMESFPGEDGSTATGSTTNWGKILQSVGNAVGSGADALGGILANAGKAATSPLGLAGLYAGLSLKDQQRINDAVLSSYGAYQTDKARKKQQYQTGVGLPSLPTTVGGVPLAQAQPRTAAQTVVRAAKGGSISDLYNEYSELNNRMRNYRRLAKGGLV
jgi:hypothetical protein